MNDTLRVQLLHLWKSTIGNLPSQEQFAIWGSLHSAEVIRKAILKTAMKNQAMSGQMTQDHRLRFASKVMTTLTETYPENAKNRERLQQESQPNSRVWGNGEMNGAGNCKGG